MPDYCISTLICVKQDQAIFEAIGYRLDSAELFLLDGEGIPDAIVMMDDHAAGGHYDELTKLKNAPFVASNTACRGVFGDHLLASDGRGRAYAEALCESICPAVRVNPDGGISSADLADARSYWQVYNRAVETFKRPASSTAAGKGNQP